MSTNLIRSITNGVEEGLMNKKASIMNPYQNAQLWQSTPQRTKPLCLNNSTEQNASKHLPSSINNDKVKISKRDEDIIKITLKEDARCKWCISNEKEKCVIRLGTANRVIVTCDECRKASHRPITRCMPNIVELEKHFPDHHQIIESKKRIQAYLDEQKAGSEKVLPKQPPLKKQKITPAKTASVSSTSTAVEKDVDEESFPGIRTRRQLKSADGLVNGTEDDNSSSSSSSSEPMVASKAVPQNSKNLKILDKGEEGTKMIFKGDLRCQKCIAYEIETCIIWIGKKGRSVARCETCRVGQFAVTKCGPNLDILQKHFPNNLEVKNAMERIVRECLTSMEDQQEMNSSAVDQVSQEKGMTAKKPQLPPSNRTRLEVNGSSSNASPSGTSTVNQLQSVPLTQKQDQSRSLLTRITEIIECEIDDAAKVTAIRVVLQILKKDFRE